jgi:molecular chaperone GrpE (heat shock protein)
MSKKKKVKRRMTLSGSRPGLVSGRRTFGEETKGEEILQMMKKDIACQEVHNNKEAVKGETPKGGEAHNETAHEAAAEATHKAALEVSHEAALEADHEALHETSQETAHKINQKTAPEISIAKVHGGENDELKIRGTRISDSLLMQLEDEAIGFINRRLEEHVAKRIKGILVPVAKLSLKMQKVRKKLTADEGGKASETSSDLLDLEDDLDYILESSKVKRVSPSDGEKFNPSLHEEADFSWNPDREELEILATIRDGFFWEYNQEMIVKPQVIVNRRLSA